MLTGVLENDPEYGFSLQSHSLAPGIQIAHRQTSLFCPTMASSNDQLSLTGKIVALALYDGVVPIVSTVIENHTFLDNLRHPSACVAERNAHSHGNHYRQLHRAYNSSDTFHPRLRDRKRHIMRAFCRDSAVHLPTTTMRKRGGFQLSRTAWSFASRLSSLIRGEITNVICLKGLRCESTGLSVLEGLATHYRSSLSCLGKKSSVQGVPGRSRCLPISLGI